MKDPWGLKEINLFKRDKKRNFSINLYNISALYFYVI